MLFNNKNIIIFGIIKQYFLIMKNDLLVIPSIDIKNGKTVRVVKGIPELGCKNYGDDPVDMAMIWRAENAKCIHVVDFDASQEKSKKNFNVIARLCESVIIPVELGGGISSVDDAREALSLGVYRLIIGTMVYENPQQFRKIFEEFGPSKIAAAIDYIDEELIIQSRSIKTGINVYEYANKLKEIGLQRLVVTDVSRNGMLTGPNTSVSAKIGRNTGLKITHSGGVGSFQDLQKVKEVVASGVDSVIIGRALYENKFPCQRIWRVAESGIFS